MKMKVKLIKDVIVNGKACKSGEVVEVEGLDYVELKSSGAAIDYVEEKPNKKEVSKQKND